MDGLRSGVWGNGLRRFVRRILPDVIQTFRLIYLRQCLPTIRVPPNEGQFSARVRAVPAAAITTRPGRNGVSNPAATDNLLLKMLISREIDYVRRAAVQIEPVSAESLPKTGIFAEMDGDFWRFPPHVRQSGSPETKANARKAGISGPFWRLFGSPA